ncbi:MAG: TetR/AcrR family transcriptional regulator [Sphingopyxis sp.]|uniref:TetR/AcrR family transcriptional regulator n=1 Tax=Sphingopyxis sp. TaxID=1908224 RepID=UPI002AB8BBAC|nr:TetR/AcrR family transcriptional regulator [Sphingopyxis sp.]MDZ3832792.1 TetR/AcrR family transcriptional regulator [Sphingopyxis sp.]
MTSARNRIIEAAFRLFLKQGYENASMAELVAVTGLSKGAVYHHFRDKEALHDAAIDHFFLRFFSSTISGNVNSDKLDCVLDLDALVGAMIADFSRLLETVTAIVPDVGAYYRFLFDALPKVRPFIRDRLSGAQAAVAVAMRCGQKRGQLNPSLDPDAAAMQCLAMIEGAALLCVLDGAGEWDAAFERTILPFVESLRVRPSA